MPFEILTISCLRDNYAFLIHNDEIGQTALVDAPEEAAIESALSQRGWSLNQILITHHHADHVDGVAALRSRHNAQVVGASADAHRLPPLDIQVSPGDQLSVCGAMAHVIDVSGHTVGHVAFHLPEVSAVFTADSLMALGCGRLFEGTPQQMWDSLSRLAALPPESWVYSGHEYTAANARFAVTIEPENRALADRVARIASDRAQDIPTVPSRLSDECATNPFLRASEPRVKKALGMENAEDWAVFAEIRARKDRF
ncbi:MAG: hydroxyacylglutathione hydrolase [Pseudomonadota bacterium]